MALLSSDARSAQRRLAPSLRKMLKSRFAHPQPKEVANKGRYCPDLPRWLGAKGLIVGFVGGSK